LARFEAAQPTPNPPSAHTDEPEAPFAAEALGDTSAATEAIRSPREEISDEPNSHSDGANDILFTVVPDHHNHAKHIGPKATDAVPVPQDPENSNASRLSGLRGFASAESLKELLQARRPAAQVNETVTPTSSVRTSGEAANEPARQEALASGASRLSRLRGIVSARSLREFGQPKQPVPLESDRRAVRHRVSPEKITGLAADPATPKPHAPAQTFVSYPKPDSSLTGPGGRNQEIGSPTPSPAGSEHVPPQIAIKKPGDRPDTWNGFQILPSRRGQYRKSD
jgi:hypothetical protein